MCKRTMGILLTSLVTFTLHPIKSEPAQARQPYGYFEGSVETKWLENRTMVLLKGFEYIDPNQKHWKVPENTVVDGASIPRMFWTLVGGPFEGPYRNASVVHDYYCVSRTEPWRAVHRMFYYAMLAGGTPVKKAKLMYYAVFVGGPRWKQVYYTNHPPRAVPKPGDVDYYKTESWSIALDERRANEDIAWIDNTEPSLEDIEKRAAQTFKGTEPPGKVRLDAKNP